GAAPRREDERVRSRDSGAHMPEGIGQPEALHYPIGCRHVFPKLRLSVSHARLVSSFHSSLPNCPYGIEEIPAPPILLDAGAPQADLSAPAFEGCDEGSVRASGCFGCQHQALALAGPASPHLEDGHD